MVDRIEGFQRRTSGRGLQSSTAAKVAKRKKKPSKKFRDAYAHTPLSAAEEIPWKCRRLVIGTGAQGNLPVIEETRKEAARRDIELVVLPTAQAIKELRKASPHTNAILHITC